MPTENDGCTLTEIMEKRIDSTVLLFFRQNGNDDWNGPKKFEALDKLWSKLTRLTARIKEKDFLKVLETHMDSTVLEFFNCSQEGKWTGPENFLELYNFWYLCKEQSSESSMNSSSQVDANCHIESRLITESEIADIPHIESELITEPEISDIPVLHIDAGVPIVNDQSLEILADITLNSNEGNI